MIAFNRMSLAQFVTLSLASCCALSAIQSIAHADDPERITLLEESDSLYLNSDKHYTQGLRLSDLAPEIGAKRRWNGPFDLAASIAPIFSRDGSSQDGSETAGYSRRYALFLGQSIFTPKNLTLKPPVGGSTLVQACSRSVTGTCSKTLRPTSVSSGRQH